MSDDTPETDEAEAEAGADYVPITELLTAVAEVVTATTNGLYPWHDEVTGKRARIEPKAREPLIRILGDCERIVAAVRARVEGD